MGTTYRFISDPLAPQAVVEWFRSLPSPPVEIPSERGSVLYFSADGALSYDAGGRIIPEESAVATLFLPRERRGMLWTVGEVHFRTSRMKERYPQLQKISLAFARWLAAHPCVYSNKLAENEFAYYLEGSTKSHDSPVYALESGMDQLQSGRYFVGDDDNEYVIDNLCKALRLRGIECGPA